MKTHLKSVMSQAKQVCGMLNLSLFIPLFGKSAKQLGQAFIFLLVFSPFLGQSFAQQELKGIIPGDALGWEIQEINILLALGQDSPVSLEIYSPGFDPDDYRAALDGGEELGDERYDKGLGELLGEFVLEQDGVVIAQGSYSVEHHRWEVFFEGELKAGAYNVRTSFKGKAKNAFVYRLSTPDPSVGSLSFAEGIELFDVQGRDWVKGFDISLPIEGVPSRYGLYDGDGESELNAKVVMPDGSERALPMSDSKEWVTWEFDQPGRYQVFLRIPQDAYQYSNTIALKEIMPNPVFVDVVNSSGAQLDFPYSLRGYSIRNVDFVTPEGWQLIRVEQEGAQALSNTALRFGYEGGQARYVLEQLKAQDAQLSVDATLVLPNGERPYALSFTLNEEAFKLSESGKRTFSLSAGTYELNSPNIAGARIESSATTLTLKEGEQKSVSYRIYPEVKLELTASPNDLLVGERTRIRTVASTLFPDFVPADLALVIPAELVIQDNPRIVAPISATSNSVLEFDALATTAGLFSVQSILEPWALSLNESVRVRENAQLSLVKTVDKEAAALGESVLFTLTVSNEGGVAATGIRLIDVLPSGLEGNTLDLTFNLEAGENKTFELPAKLSAKASNLITNTAQLTHADTGTTLDASASINVLRPVAELSRALDKDIVLPGEQVQVDLFVTNSGKAKLNYDLTDTHPDWLSPESSVHFSGQLEPGESNTHSYTAMVRFGAEVASEFSATLSYSEGELNAADLIKRVLMPLEKLVNQSIIVEGSSAVFSVRTQNPLDRAISVELRESPAAGLGLQADRLIQLDLEANEVREFEFIATPKRLGFLDNEVSIFFGTTPVAIPASAQLEVKPVLEPQRFSTIRLPFQVDYQTGDELLIRHEVPTGALYELGSSTLEGSPLADPRITYEETAEGEISSTLYWLIPFRQAGMISYQVKHRDALGPLSEPALSLKIAERENQLQGDLSFSELSKSRTLEQKERNGLIREPLPGQVFRLVDQTKIIIESPISEDLELKLNGVVISDEQLGKLEYSEISNTQRLEYFGLPLELGSNLIEVSVAGQRDQVEVKRAGQATQLVITPITLLADGVTPVSLEIKALDNAGVSTGFGALTIDSSVEPSQADAFPERSGYQVLLEDGVAILKLEPVSSARSLNVRASFNDLYQEDEFYLGGTTQTLYHFIGSVTAHYDFADSSFGLEGSAKGYLETPLANGTLQIAVDSDGGISSVEDPIERFPLTGSGFDAELPLRSDDYVAARYDDDTFSVGYYAGDLSVPGVSVTTATALQAEARLGKNQNFVSQGFIGILPDTIIHKELNADGTRLYKLDTNIKVGSERISIRKGSLEEPLKRLDDYSINYATGQLILHKALFPTDPLYPNQSISLIANYTVNNALRTHLAYGAGASYQLADWFAEAGIAQEHGLRFGSKAGYRSDNGGFSVTYAYAQDIAQAGLQADYALGAFSTNLSLNYITSLAGQARLAYAFSETQNAAIEHSASDGNNRSYALYELKLAPFSFGIGAGYQWEQNAYNAVGRAGYEQDKFGIKLTHAQELGNGQSLSDFKFSYRIDENLSTDLGLAYLWGIGFDGSLGLIQNLGNGNLSLSYQLPGVSGNGNRARLGINTPIPLNKSFDLDLGAGYEQNFNDGSSATDATLGVRYSNESLKASLATDLSYQNGSDNFKVVFRGGVSGQLDKEQVLSLNSTYQVLPEAKGDFTLSYALRSDLLTLLTYHRLETGVDSLAEGEIAPTFSFGTQWQLRPAFAYRIPFASAAGATYLVSLGSHYYFNDNFGAGAAVHQQWQPGTDASLTAFSLEGSTRLIDDIWLALGYTLNGYDGLSSVTHNGIYVRLDVLGGSQ